MVKFQHVLWPIAAGLVAGTFSAPLARGGVLFSTDFESYSLDTVNGQFGWTVGGDGADGLIISTDATKALRIGARANWGEEVRRVLDAPSTQRYLAIEMDFRQDNTDNAFWFMDVNRTTGSSGPDSMFWMPELMATNSDPGIKGMHVDPGVWYHCGFEIDQAARKIIGVNYDGVWKAEIDLQLNTAEYLDLLVFRGTHISDTDPTASYGLIIDNLSILDAPSPITPAPSTWVGAAGGSLLWGRRKR